MHSKLLDLKLSRTCPVPNDTERGCRITKYMLFNIILHLFICLTCFHKDFSQSSKKLMLPTNTTF